MNLTIQYLVNMFGEARSLGANFIGVKIQMEGFEEPEVIINPSENFYTKLEYYKRAYNDDLTLKAFNGIKIIDVAYGEDYLEIQEMLY